MVYRETYSVKILEREVKRRKKAKTERAELKSRFEVEGAKKTPAEILGAALRRPWLMVWEQPRLFLVPLYVAVIYGLFYLVCATLGANFELFHGFGQGKAGLTYIGLGKSFLYLRYPIVRVCDRQSI